MSQNCLKPNPYHGILRDIDDFVIPKGFRIDTNEDEAIARKLMKIRFSELDSSMVGCAGKFLDFMYKAHVKHIESAWIARSGRLLTIVLRAMLELKTAGALKINYENIIKCLNLDWLVKDAGSDKRIVATKSEIHQFLCDLPGFNYSHIHPKSYENFGYLAITIRGAISPLVEHKQKLYSQVPLRIGGAYRLGGPMLAKIEVEQLFLALEAYGHTRQYILNALIQSQLEKSLFSGKLTPAERRSMLAVELQI